MAPSVAWKDATSALHYGGLEQIKKIKDLGIQDVHQQTLLHAAASSGKRDAAKWLIQQGLDVNSQDCDGCTPLWIAAFEGHEKMVKFLIQMGADPFIEGSLSANSEKKTPRSACESESICLLLKEAERPKSRGKKSKRSSKRGEIEKEWEQFHEKVNELVEKGKEIQRGSMEVLEADRESLQTAEKELKDLRLEHSKLKQENEKLTKKKAEYRKLKKDLAMFKDMKEENDRLQEKNSILQKELSRFKGDGLSGVSMKELQELLAKQKVAVEKVESAIASVSTWSPFSLNRFTKNDSLALYAWRKKRTL